jgi:hypothetical protein
MRQWDARRHCFSTSLQNTPLEGQTRTTCCTHGREDNTYKLLERNSEGKRPLGRPRDKWEILKQIVRKWDGRA